MAPFESRETLEPTAYDGPVSASRRHSRLRACGTAAMARRARAQQRSADGNEKLLLASRNPRSCFPGSLEAHLSRKKGCCLRAILSVNVIGCVCVGEAAGGRKEKTVRRSTRRVSIQYVRGERAIPGSRACSMRARRRIFRRVSGRFFFGARRRALPLVNTFLSTIKL